MVSAILDFHEASLWPVILTRAFNLQVKKHLDFKYSYSLHS